MTDGPGKLPTFNFPQDESRLSKINVTLCNEKQVENRIVVSGSQPITGRGSGLRWSEFVKNFTLNGGIATTLPAGSASKA